MLLRLVGNMITPTHPVCVCTVCELCEHNACCALFCLLAMLFSRIFQQLAPDGNTDAVRLWPFVCSTCPVIWRPALLKLVSCADRCAVSGCFCDFTACFHCASRCQCLSHVLSATILRGINDATVPASGPMRAGLAVLCWYRDIP